MKFYMVIYNYHLPFIQKWFLCGILPLLVKNTAQILGWLFVIEII